MSPNYIDEHSHPSKMHHPTPNPERSTTVYILLAICYLLIAITMYLAWQKASSG